MAIILTVVCSLNFLFAQPVYAAGTEQNIFTLEGTTETVVIDGISYTYNYYLENGDRVITIANNANNTVDKMVYDVDSSIIYLNGEIFATIENKPSISRAGGGKTADGWEILSTSSHYISWAQGTTAAIVATAIAAYLGVVTAGNVIAIMGISALGVLAAATSGGTLYVELHMYYVLFVQPQYRTVWTFTANTGDSYGPYYHHYYM